ncbi:MAG: PilC/PilY family type IV pilus protein [Candidatus Aminicenantales bacterium]
MRKKGLRILAITLIGLTLFILKFSGQQPTPCTETEGRFNENFDTDDFKDKVNSSVANWPPGPVHLNYLGANFAVTAPTGMGGHIYVCAPADFDGDGLPDLVGLDIASRANYSLKLIRNAYEDLDGDGQDDNGIIFRVDNNKIFDSSLIVGPASITAGDYNDDGLVDFFFYKNRYDSFSYSDFVACMYINQGTKTDPVFFPRSDPKNLNFTARFQAAGIYCNWAANHLCTVDIDKDGDLDILVASQDKIFLLRNPGKTNFTLDSWEISELNYNERTGYKAPVPGGFTDRGTSAVTAGDFDLDGDIDVVAGSVNAWPYLAYYKNDGTGRFIRHEIPISNQNCTGTVALGVTDFKKDGRPDIFGATDRWNAGNQARMWLFKNMGLQEYTDPEGNAYYEVTWNFTCLNACQPIIPPFYDVDLCAILDHDQDGDMDIVLADANHSGDYYLIINQLAGVYNLYGEAVSTNVSNINPRQYSITRARIRYVNQGVHGSSSGLKIQYFLSNDGGLHWEPYLSFEGSNIQPYNGTEADWHTFDHFGADLRWKAVLAASEDEMEEYSGASFDTPLIRQLQLDYIYVGRKEYARSSVATSVIDRSGQNRKLIIAASFVYPGWEGHLRAYDVTGMTPAQTTYSTLRTVSTSDLGSATGRWIAEGVELLWDAGDLLDERSPDSRTIYTAINPNRPDAGPLERIDFNLSNVDTLGPILGDYQNDPQGLIRFVRGYDRYWKLGDINHSTPAVVGPPDGDPSLMGSGYAEFKQSLSSRRKVIYVGANDGMLHCFDAASGEELWAFIPYNLLSKLKEMWPVDSATNHRYFARRAYVDGSPSVEDVYINGQWRTVLICGQGEGNGQAPDGEANIRNNNYYYYFALDITEPLNPIPLWEFAGARIHGSGKNYYMSNGQTWSVPYIAKVNISGAPTWVAFIGSGYTHPSDAGYAAYIGNTFAAIKVEDGSVVFNSRINDLDSSRRNNSANPFLNIYVSLPGSPNGADFIRDSNSLGFVDHVYFGDMDGRVWRLDVTSGNPGNWRMTEIYRDRCLYPIITKPEVWIGETTAGSTYPKIYFGTGGHEAAPPDRYYSFVALIDDKNKPQVEWFVGNPDETGLPNSLKVASFEPGEKVWADPVISDYIVYFSTLKGSIEAADPCQNLGDFGRLYARFIRAGMGVPLAGSALKDARGQTIEYFTLASKARTAVTLGERQRAGGLVKRDIYVQEYDSTIEKLEQPVGALLRIKSWREIYRIIR